MTKMGSYQFDFIKGKAAKDLKFPKGNLYVKAGKRIYFESCCDHSCLVTGFTYVLNDEGTYVKRISNYFSGI